MSEETAKKTDHADPMKDDATDSGVAADEHARTHADAAASEVRRTGHEPYMVDGHVRDGKIAPPFVTREAERLAQQKVGGAAPVAGAAL